MLEIESCWGPFFFYYCRWYCYPFLVFETRELSNYDIPCFASHLVLGSLKCYLTEYNLFGL